MAESSEHVLFICYSHTDQEYKDRFDKFLATPNLIKGLTIFSDKDIKPGEAWQQLIVENLQRATAALLLVSQDFIVSPFIQQVELQSLLEAQVRRNLRLFFVAVRAAYVEGTTLADFQWARPYSKPLSVLSVAEQEQAMLDVCRHIADVLTTKEAGPSAEQTIRCLANVPKLDLPAYYELEGPVGDGQFARCYLAKDRLFDRHVIVKVLKSELARESPAYDRYVRSASRLKHPNIVSPLFSQANKLPHFLVTPSIDGPTLEERLAGEGTATPPTFEEAVRCTICLADTLAYAHARDCVHGRLRPCEVRFNGNDEQPMLTGFRTMDDAPDGVSMFGENGRLTLADFLYASPETRRAGRVDPKSDQYLLGLVAYEMIAGAHPVPATSWASLLSPDVAAGVAAPPALKSRADNCDARVSDVVMRMLAIDPQERWADLDTVRRKLEEAQSGALCVEIAKESYRRCAQDAAFYATLYDKLFAAMPQIEAMFHPDTRANQYRLLRDAVWLLLTYPGVRDQQEPTVLSHIARSHAHLESMQFDEFREAIVAAVAEHDSTDHDLLDAWRQATKPGFDYLKSKLVTASSPTSTAAALPASGPMSPLSSTA